ncbi:uncharacterized protein [Euwallacea fornicatus]|uniref:uncharacterized protein isoform X2 n=1 Tax=Euwallacea fornicatus TaxID=995702 RepID=UPI00338D579B
MSSPSRDETKASKSEAEVLQETEDILHNWTIDVGFRRLSRSSRQENVQTDEEATKWGEYQGLDNVSDRGGSTEKRSKILQLPTWSSPRECEREIMGDDSSKNRVHIECECELPGLAGGAVPVMTSFIQSGNENDDKERGEKDEVVHKFRSSLISKFSSNFRSARITSPTKSSHGPPPIEEGGAVSSICFSESPTIPTNLMQHSSNGLPSKPESEEEHDLHLLKEEARRLRRYKKLTSDFAKYVSKLAEETSDLSEISNPEAQASVVEDLCKHVVNLKKIANELKTIENRASSEPLIPKDPLNPDLRTKQTKDINKIYIKFLPSKATIKKRKSCNSEAQTESEEDASRDDAKVVDSVDGMFIPSFDDPPETDDEDDDEEGLDIAIRIPELQKTLNQHASHLSIISAEALGRIKRCPKEFTLKMDFVMGKVFFQPARAPASNFAIGPNFRKAGCTKSDLISIKLSTECLYASQIIPVEGATRKDSIEFLRSADSEFFNAVSLPQATRRSSAATKSCVSLRSAREYLLGDWACCKSMPQIPSLKRILEEPEDRIVNAGMAAVRPWSRESQRKRASASWENVGRSSP